MANVSAPTENERTVTGMDEYIEREAAVEAAKHACSKGLEPSQYIEIIPSADVEPVRHGRWERCGGDLNSSGYEIYCSICNKTHFVHYKYSLGGFYGCKELFEKPKYCPSCGAFMEFEE